MIWSPLFADDVIDTWGNFAASNVDTGGKLISTTPAVPVAKFATGVVDTGGAP
jgi:hypothetical protein